MTTTLIIPPLLRTAGSFLLHPPVDLIAELLRMEAQFPILCCGLDVWHTPKKLHGPLCNNVHIMHSKRWAYMCVFFFLREHLKTHLTKNCNQGWLKLVLAT